MKNLVVAIDGPAGSGKSSICKKISSLLGFTHIDTGAMYRAVTLQALRLGIDMQNEAEYSFINNISIIYKEGITYLNGEDVSKEIRSREVTNNVSLASKYSTVREKMLDFQRESAKEGLVLMDGRDIGTVVLPNADIKIFLTASNEERAKRRYKELVEAGAECNYEVILQEIIERDYKDSHREIAPLKKADDAILVDTTSMTFDEVVNTIIKMISERLNSMEEIFSMDSIELSDLRPGDVVKGTVVSVDGDKTIYIGIPGVYTEGTMHLDHYTKDKSVTSFKGLVKVGDVIECEVAKVTEEHIYLSRLNQLVEESYKEVATLVENVVPAYIKSAVDGKGYIVKIKSVEGFMPRSQATPSVEVGKTLDVKILEVDQDRKRVVVSRRVVEVAIAQQQREAELATLNAGDVVKGVVSKVEKYGALVKFNTVQGLLKTNQVAHEFINIEEVLHVGDEIEVKILSKSEDGKLELSRKALLKTPFELFCDAHKVSDKIVGKVAAKLQFGLLLEVAPNVRGLLHTSEYSHNPNDNYQAYIKLGDEIEVAILSIDEKKEKVSLSRKVLMDNPWERVTAKLDDVVTYKVTEVQERGLLVSSCGVDAFIPASECVTDGKSELKSFYAVGDEGEAKVIFINKKEWKLRLSILVLKTERDDAEMQKYLGNDENISTSLGDLLKDLD